MYNLKAKLNFTVTNLISILEDINAGQNRDKILRDLSEIISHSESSENVNSEYNINSQDYGIILSVYKICKRIIRFEITTKTIFTVRNKYNLQYFETDIKFSNLGKDMNTCTLSLGCDTNVTATAILNLVFITLGLVTNKVYILKDGITLYTEYLCNQVLRVISDIDDIFKRAIFNHCNTLPLFS